MNLIHVRATEEMEDAALLMKGLVESNKDRYPDQIELLDDYYKGSWFLDDSPRVPVEYSPPLGDVVVAYDEFNPVGTVAIYRMDNTYCELKSMFVPVEHRGKGVAKALCLDVLSSAKEMGFKVVRLTTGEKQPEARSLYVKVGFNIVTPWEANPPDGFDYFENKIG